MGSSVTDTVRARWLEMTIVSSLSIITSAVVVTWTVSATLAKFEAKLEAHDVRLSSVEQQERQAQADNSAQAAQIAVQSSQWTEVIRRLDAIDKKLERK